MNQYNLSFYNSSFKNMKFIIILKIVDYKSY